MTDHRPGWKSRRTPAKQPDSASFAARLNRLFDTIYPPGRGPYTSQELVRVLEDRGLALSAPNLSQLRSGQRVQPSMQTAALIAEFFGIRPDYFTGEDEVYLQRVEAELGWLELAHDRVDHADAG